MAQNTTFNANLRADIKPQVLRRQGLLPATIYAKDMESISIQLLAKDFVKLYHEVGDTTVINLDVDGKKYPVLVQNVQYDWLGDNPIHFEFHKINLKEKVTVSVPLEYIGQSPASKQGAFVQHLLTEIEVFCLPNNIPHQIEVDMSQLIEIGDTFHISDLKIPKDVEVISELDEMVVKVNPPQEEEIDEEIDEEAPAEPEVISEKKVEETEE